MSVRLSRMSEDSFFTQLALNVQTRDEFVSTAFEQVLARTPTASRSARSSSLSSAKAGSRG